MEQQHSSTSKVTVEYHDPHDVYKLLAPGLVPRLPLHNLHWQSHGGPLRSIGTLHIDLVRAGDEPSAASTPGLRRSDSASTVRDDGFQTQNLGGRAASSETVESSSVAAGPTANSHRRHQIPGLRRTPYLKVLLVRCDDNDSYKSSVRSEVREWIKTHTQASTSSSKKSSKQEKHDAFDWLIVHVVIPNSTAATQPRSSSSKSESGGGDSKSSSRWRGGSTPLLEKLRSDFNSSGKNSVDHIVQIRIGINDLPYDLLPRVVPAVPSGYTETQQDAENAWDDLVSKFKDRILTSFDKRVSQYEEDVKEKDSQRNLPGWNFCTFFILKEGLARGFESVGLVEDALVGYDELSVGLDSVVEEQAVTDSPERHGGALLEFTDDLKKNTQSILSDILGDDDDEEAVDLQSKETPSDQFDDIPITATKKAYRDLILANNVSVFDFRCYIFARQITLLLRLANAQSSREELLAKLKEQQDSVLHGVAPRAPPPQKKHEESEDLSRLAEICTRTLEFIPSVSQIMREDIATALATAAEDGSPVTLSPTQEEVIENIIASFAFSVAQQVLAQTSTKALPIPASSLPSQGADEQKVSIPEPKTMMHPARNSSLQTRPVERPPPSPNLFPSPGRSDGHDTSMAKPGVEELAARRADLYLLSRSILGGLGKKRKWSDGWDEAPLVQEPDMPRFEEISLDDDADDPSTPKEAAAERESATPLAAGVSSRLLRTAIDNPDDFYRLFEILTDKAMLHFIVAGHSQSVHSSKSDLAVLKYFLKEYRTAAEYFYDITPWFGKTGWSWLELSLLLMYTHCLKEQQSKEYVGTALKLLTKACFAEKQWLEKKNLIKIGEISEPQVDMSTVQEAVGSISELTRSLPNEAKMPLEHFLTDIQLVGSPTYHEGEDVCDVNIQVQSLLPGEIAMKKAALRVSCVDDGPCKDIWFEKNDEFTLKRGTNVVKVSCKSLVPGSYKVDHLRFVSGSLLLHFDRDPNLELGTNEPIFRHPEVKLYQQPDALDIDLTATKHTALDKNSSLDLVVKSGWNDVKGCEVRVKPATGGLRLLTTDASIVDTDEDFAKPPEAGAFHLGPIAAHRTSTVRFPFTVEQDIGTVVVKVEIYYHTDADGKFYLVKSIPIHISLALGVNVQDIFKHNALFSRFSVSTDCKSPLRLFKSELQESELFKSSFGAAPTSSVFIFAKQPADLLYRVQKKGEDLTAKDGGKTMYLKLHYSRLDLEIEELLRAELSKVVGQSKIAPFTKAIETVVVGHARAALRGSDLERAALLGEFSTAFLAQIPWKSLFKGLGNVDNSGADVGPAVAAFFDDWLKSRPQLSIPTSGIIEESTILIPVEIPSVSIVHTTDVRFHHSTSGALNEVGGGTHTVTVGQVLSATLHLKWTRIWKTDSQTARDQEFSYEITAPSDSWLLGGRRKGHFVIPSDSALSSTPETEAEIPLMLIPQREGWLPYPSVEIREISAEGEVVEQQAQNFEVDARNIGETVRVIGGRKGVTVSLDASGPGGGPLVLEGERIKTGTERIFA